VSTAHSRDSSSPLKLSVSKWDRGRIQFWSEHLGMTMSALTRCCIDGDVPSPIPATTRLALCCLESFRPWVKAEALSDLTAHLLEERAPVIEPAHSRHISLRLGPRYRENLRLRAAICGTSVSGFVAASFRLLDDFPFIAKIEIQAVTQIRDFWLQLTLSAENSHVPPGLEIEATLRQILEKGEGV